MKNKWLFKAFFMVAGAIGLRVCYDVTHFKVQKYQLKSHKINRDYHFVVLSDLHDKMFGYENEQLLEAIHKINPEAVYIAGDMITAVPGKKYNHTLRFLEALSKSYPVYYGSGNHEYRLRIDTEKYGNMSAFYEKALSDMGIQRLKTGSCTAHRKDIKVYGIEIERMYYKKRRMPVMAKDYSIQKIGMADQDCYSILLAHNPEYFKNYAATNVDLVLSGHVHGGIAKLPVLGGVISPKLRLFPKYDGGQFKINNTTMLLSRGLGCHTIPIRFLNPGELLDVTIEKV